MILLDTSVLVESLTEKGSLKAQFRRRLAADEPMAVWHGHLLLEPPSRWSGCGRASLPGNAKLAQ